MPQEVVTQPLPVWQQQLQVKHAVRTFVESMVLKQLKM